MTVLGCAGCRERLPNGHWAPSSQKAVLRLLSESGLPVPIEVHFSRSHDDMELVFATMEDRTRTREGLKAVLGTQDFHYGFNEYDLKSRPHFVLHLEGRAP